MLYEEKSLKAGITFADCSIASVARLTGAAVASNHVETQGVLVAVVESAEALVMLWKQKQNKKTAHVSLIYVI